MFRAGVETFLTTTKAELATVSPQGGIWALNNDRHRIRFALSQSTEQAVVPKPHGAQTRKALQPSILNCPKTAIARNQPYTPPLPPRKGEGVSCPAKTSPAPPRPAASERVFQYNHNLSLLGWVFDVSLKCLGFSHCSTEKLERERLNRNQKRKNQTKPASETRTADSETGEMSASF